MKGWQIFVHSIRMVLNNLGPAFRVSGILYLVQAVSQVMILRNAPQYDIDGMPAPGPSGTGELLLYLGLAVLASLWIAVGWHRYVLTGERPSSFLPRWHGAELAAYLWTSVKVGVLVMVALMLTSGIGVLLSAFLPALIGGMMFGLFALGFYIFLRVGAALPAAAMGEATGLRAAWRATGPHGGDIVAVTLLMLGGTLLAELPTMLDGDAGSAISVIYTLVVNWFVTMFGISVLTTIYGHCIQGRPID